MSLVPRQPHDELEEALAVSPDTNLGALSFAPEVVPLAHTARQVERTFGRQEPRPAFRYTAAAHFAEQVRAREVRRSQRFTPWRPAIVGFATLLILLLTVAGVAAAGNAIPGDPLYPVKRLHESVQLTLTDDAISRAELHADFAERRVDELRRMGDRADENQTSALTTEIAQHREQALAATRDGSLDSRDEATHLRLDRLRARLDPEPVQDVPPAQTASETTEVPPAYAPAEPIRSSDNADTTEDVAVDTATPDTGVGVENPIEAVTDDFQSEGLALAPQAAAASPPASEDGPSPLADSAPPPPSPTILRTPTPTALPMVVDTDPVTVPVAQAPATPRPTAPPLPTHDEVSSLPVDPVADPVNRTTAVPTSPLSSSAQIAPAPSHDPDLRPTPTVEPTRRRDEPDPTPRRILDPGTGQVIRATLTPTQTREPTAEPTAPRRPSPTPTATLRPPRPTLTSRPDRPPALTAAPRLRD